jgi:carbon monoxide dehydrogenase subunit G
LIRPIDLPGAPPEQAFVVDVASMAKCIPGAESVEDLGNNQCRATLKIRVGPIGPTLATNISIVEKDEAN